MKFLAIPILLFATTSFANANQITYSYTASGCDASGCNEISSGEFVGDTSKINLLGEQTVEVFARKKKSAGLISKVSSKTGTSLSVANKFVNGIVDAALAAGFTDFSATLSGPNQSVSFKGNLKTGKWSVDAHFEGVGEDKVKQPDEGDA